MVSLTPLLTVPLLLLSPAAAGAAAAVAGRASACAAVMPRLTASTSASGSLTATACHHNPRQEMMMPECRWQQQKQHKASVCCPAHKFARRSRAGEDTYTAQTWKCVLCLWHAL
ncbi:hypothetical protein COO60DRAFT_1500619 [Scenedesmus sp. NREL 46B-D3]|nr:hypothetical protein COO60DRAFT_1500619 [Scenedesmus sp. NREL 46B-D3]